MTFARILLPLIMVFGGPATVAAEQVTEGTALAVDGDTLNFSGTHIHLFGADAPEAQQTCTKDAKEWNCGKQAREFLAQLIGQESIRCRSRKADADGTMQAKCTLDDLDLALAMIEAGLAVTTEHSPVDYVGAEQLRKTHGIGLWSGEFQPPQEWRAINVPKTPTQPTPIARGAAKPLRERVFRNKFGCAIKGNRNRKGQWIYHLPGKPYYDQTRPEELFCTESDARAAGYRRSKA